MLKKSYSELLVAILCGGCTTLILAARYTVDLALGFTMDGREIFLILGAAIAGPRAAIVMSIFVAIGILIGYPNNPTAGSIIDTACHLAGTILLSLIYKNVIYAGVKRPLRIFAWIILVPIYYWVLLTPGGSILYYVVGLAPSPFYLMALPIWPEVIVTTVATTLIMVALPEKWRRPLWGSSASTRATQPAAGLA